VARARWASCHGWTTARIADALDLSTATLLEWQHRWQDPDDRLKPRNQGAPRLDATPQERKDVRDFLALFGTDLDVHTLHDHFPAIARRDLRILLHLTQQDLHHQAQMRWYRSVTWHSPNRAWAMDHTEPPTPIDHQYRFVLTVRDLASGATLAAHAVERMDAASTIACLRDLITRHGAPLLIKADNGGAFAGNDTREFLNAQGIALLLSPPYTPSYNGACEAGNGTLKRLTHDIATAHDRPECWTLDDLEAARLRANRRITNRRQTTTPEQRFADSTTITDQERRQFLQAIAGARQRRLHALAVETGQPQRTMSADALNRQAITDALTGIGVITIRNRPVRLCNPLRDVG
jgi:transposase InsO family protein